MRGVCARAGWGILALLLVVCAPGFRANAQGMIGVPPPVYNAIDPRGVDLVTGAFNVSSQDVRIGPAGLDGLTYTRTYIGPGNGQGSGWTDNLTAMITLSAANTIFTVSFGGSSEAFTLGGGVYSNNQGGGSTLTYSSGIYTYTSSMGAVATFSTTLASTYGPPTGGNAARITSMLYPDGHLLTYNYQTVSVCQTSCPGTMVSASRVQSVTNNVGYQLKLTYLSNSATTTNDLPSWTTLTNVIGLNNAYDYCSPSANTCAGPFTTTYPSATYATNTGPPPTSTTTDALNRVTTYTYSASQITAIKAPAGETTTIVYAGPGAVSTVSNGIGTWTYTYLTVSGTPELVIVDPLSHQINTAGATEPAGRIWTSG